jgi:hypothetical protein
VGRPGSRPGRPAVLKLIRSFSRRAPPAGQHGHRATAGKGTWLLTSENPAGTGAPPCGVPGGLPPLRPGPVPRRGGGVPGPTACGRWPWRAAGSARPPRSGWCWPRSWGPPSPGVPRSAFPGSGQPDGPGGAAGVRGARSSSSSPTSKPPSGGLTTDHAPRTSSACGPGQINNGGHRTTSPSPAWGGRACSGSWGWQSR